MRVSYKEIKFLKRIGIFIGVLAFLYGGIVSYFYVEKQKTAGIYKVQLIPQEGSRTLAEFKKNEYGNRVYENNHGTVCWDCKDSWSRSTRKWISYMLPSSLKPQNPNIALQCGFGAGQILIDFGAGMIVGITGAITFILEPFMPSNTKKIMTHRGDQIAYSFFFIVEGKIFKFVGNQIANLYTHLSTAVEKKKAYELCETIAAIAFFGRIGIKSTMTRMKQTKQEKNDLARFQKQVDDQKRIAELQKSAEKKSQDANQTKPIAEKNSQNVNQTIKTDLQTNAVTEEILKTKKGAITINTNEVRIQVNEVKPKSSVKPVEIKANLIAGPVKINKVNPVLTVMDRMAVYAVGKTVKDKTEVTFEDYIFSLMENASP